MELSTKYLWTTVTICLSMLCHTDSSQADFDYGDLYAPIFNGFPDTSGPQPVLDTQSVVLVVEKGTTVHLPCTVRNLDSSYQIAWLTSSYSMITTDSQVLFEDKRFSVPEMVNENYTLTISDVQQKDEDTYQCMLQTFPPQIKEVTLEVYAKPSIKKDSIEAIYKIQEGSPLHITCPATGIPKPDVSWYLYPADSVSNEEKRKQVSTTAHLNFTKLKQVHGGIYRCEAKNKHGHDMYEIFIETTYAPTPKSSQSVVIAKEGSSAMLMCEAEGVPRPGLAWQKQGHHIKHGDKYHLLVYSDTESKTVSELDFVVEIRDAGKYMCIASNQHGQNHITIKLEVVPLDNHMTQTDISTASILTTPKLTTHKLPTKRTETVPSKTESQSKATEVTSPEATPRTDTVKGAATSVSHKTISLVLLSFSTVILLVL